MSNLSRTPPTAKTSNNLTNTNALVAASNTKRTRTDDNDGASQPLTLENILAVINDKFAETFSQIKNVGRKIDLVKTELEGRIDSVKVELEVKLDTMSSDISSIKAECAARFEDNEKALLALEERVTEMSQEIGELANRNDLIVSGIPHLKGENLCAFFEAMCKHVGLDSATAIPVDVRRLKTSGAQQDGLVLLQFALRNQRDDFYSSYLRRHDLKLCHLGIDSTRRIYVNENLTVAARKIKSAALQLKKAGKISAVYTKLGTIYIKKSDVQQPVTIRSEDQLNLYRS